MLTGWLAAIPNTTPKTFSAPRARWPPLDTPDDSDFVFSGGGLPFAVFAKGGPLFALHLYLIHRINLDQSWLVVRIT